MADVTVTRGPYGWYYPYIRPDGKKSGIKILDNIYDKYYSKGYLTDAHLAMLVEGKTITFTVPSKSGERDTIVTAKLVDYVNKSGKPCKIIDFESDKISDKLIIMKNADKLIASYWNGTRFDYTKPLKFIETLDLEEVWKTYAQYQTYGGVAYCSMSVYKAFARRNNPDNFMLYGKVNEENVCVLIEEEEYIKAKTKQAEEWEAQQKEFAEVSKKVEVVRAEATKWLDSVVEQLWPGGASCTSKQIVANLAPVVSDVDVPSLSDRVCGYLTSSKPCPPASDIIKGARKNIAYTITRENYTDPATLVKFKTNLLQSLRVYYEVMKIKSFRSELADEVDSRGVDAVTEHIDIDNALSLGYFPQVQKVLLKHKTGAPRYIIMHMYMDELDLNVLKEKLLNMLKIYYDFYDMPEKDRKAIAKFIAKNNIQDYYTRISLFDDVLEILIDNSRDAKLTRPLLESVAGTPRAKVLKDKTFYFEKRGRLRRSVFVFKPMELLEELRSYIKEFNGSSGVAILVNIELDADETFIFQFYTFAEGEGDEKGFDGRRMLNLTKIYNRNHPSQKIGFNFDHDDSDNDDEDTSE